MEILLLKNKLQKASVAELTDEYESLTHKLNEIYNSAPSTSEQAVKEARKALNITRDNTFSNAEIDAFLPEGLRRKE